MKFGKTLASAVVLAAGLALAAPVASADGAIQVKFHDHDLTQIVPFFNPCTGNTHDTEITFSGLNHLVMRPNGLATFNNNTHGTFTDLSDGTTGRFVAIFVEAGGANEILTQSVRAKGVASDGSPFELSFHIHVTQNGQGEIVVDSFKGC